MEKGKKLSWLASTSRGPPLGAGTMLRTQSGKKEEPTVMEWATDRGSSAYLSAVAAPLDQFSSLHILKSLRLHSSYAQKELLCKNSWDVKVLYKQESYVIGDIPYFPSKTYI